MTQRVLLLDVVGLTQPLLAHMPNLSGLAARGASAPLAPVFPAVTCSVQSSMLTGLMPNQHGIVGNGWYFRDLGEVLLWRQSNKLVAGEKVWETAAGRFDGYTSANVGWWYAMNATNDVIVTPRPVYHQDGRKSPDCYVVPPDLHDTLTAKLGTFPLFQYWGPTANLTSSCWLIDASIDILRRYSPTLLTAYIPHLDYDFQRYGPRHRSRSAPRGTSTTLWGRCSTPRPKTASPSSLSRSTGSPGHIVRSTSTVSCVARATYRCTPNKAGNTWTRGNLALSRSPTIR
ncbi:hypothetical protein MSTO_09930 [Mycobacterium stomatepiae]|uniref:Alkaline phosphatase family protein n=1 Tax=Mycobacterium stomatepiae TaxID=470076 RepID=A0A7I7Q3D4_9MYCO|nr:hypothetical protein MSTO_09930 [Mycobacterium stomatepiae]